MNAVSLAQLPARFLFLIAYSFCSEVPSRIESFASACCSRSIFVLEDRAANAWVARAPSIPNPSSLVAITESPSLLPFSPSRNRINASLASVFNKLLNAATSILAIRAYLAGSLNISTITLLCAVAAISTFCPN